MVPFAPDHPGAFVRPSPNFGERRGFSRPDLILLHYTGMETGEGAEDWLCNPLSQVSSHYLVHEDGRIVQMVREADRAWHAGRGAWGVCEDINSCSVGIEIANPGHEFGYRDFPESQIEAVIALSLDVAARHQVPSARVLAHSDIAPGRKLDPGERFPWARLREAGLGLPLPVVLPPSGGPSLRLGDQNDAVQDAQAKLNRIGYGIVSTGLFDLRTKVVVEAFQRHFRPALVDGCVDASTVHAMDQVLAGIA
ncbi:MAG TPA: N-acetylmuramoyl-L-alanine amidase [Mesorhizobium sp.]|nr:N-acetylmuramoyl-L-alanine amidase [Mesorhizobium sp.]